MRFASVLLSLSVLFASQRGFAQPKARAFTLQRARPAMDSQGLYTLEASQVLPPWEPSLGLVLTYAHRPLVLESAARQLSVDRLVGARLQGAVGLPAGLEIGFALPFALFSGEMQTEAGTTRLDAQGISDAELSLKWRLLDTSRRALGLAVIVSATMPVGDPDRFLGTGQPSLAPRLVLDSLLWSRRLHILANVGARFDLGSSRSLGEDPRCDVPSCSTGAKLSSSDHLSWGLGAAWSLLPNRLALFVEVAGRLGLRELFDFSQLHSAHEVALGSKLYLAGRSYLLLGVGRGLHLAAANRQLGSPDVRAFLGFVFEPAMGDGDGDGIADDVDRCPTQPEDHDDFEDEDGCPDTDNDRDGIDDRDDRCPNEPEDKDGIDDKDGCPEANDGDRDGDGIADSRDKCPDDPEDKDGFEDQDGCPDRDNDGDGILDVDDLCPNKAEDKDGFEDKDGCPDPDNDGDKILDGDDKCPLEPENYNGYLDEDGCPDPDIVRRNRGKLLVLKEIYFETNRAVIKKQSYPVINAVAGALKAHRDIALLEVQGHADERGSDAHNMRLTHARARAVYRYLLRRGIKANRLSYKGYGERQPIDRAHTPAAWSKNRRVEFVIRKR